MFQYLQVELLFEVFECNLSDSSLDFSLQRFFLYVRTVAPSAVLNVSEMGRRVLLCFIGHQLSAVFVCQNRNPECCFECVRNGAQSAALVSFEISQLVRSNGVIIEYRVRAAFLRNLLTQCLHGRVSAVSTKTSGLVTNSAEFFPMRDLFILCEILQ